MVWRVSLLFGCALGFAACTTPQPGPDRPGQPAGEASPKVLSLPPPDQRREVELFSGEVHLYRFELKPGEAFSAEIDQLGLDVLGEVFGPSGLMRTIDTPLDDQGPEFLCMVGTSPKAALLDLRIRPYEKELRGRYALTVRRRTASDWDRQCDRLNQRFDELEMLRWADGASTADKVALIPRYEELARGLRDLDLPFQAAAALKALAQLRELEGRIPEQEQAYREALELVRRAGHRHQEGMTSNQLGVAQDKLGDLAGAHASFRRSMKIFSERGDRAREAIVRNNLGKVERLTGNWLEALEAYEQAYTVLDEEGLLRRAAIAQSNAAVCLTVLQRFPDALDLLRESRATLEREGPPHELADVWVDTGLVYHHQGEYGKAQDAYNLALQLTELPADRSKILRRTAAVHRRLGRDEDSLRDYQRALELARDSGSEVEEAQVRLGLAAQLQRLARPEEAIEQLESAYPALTRIEDPDRLAYAQAVWARADRDLGRPEDAKRRMEQAFRLIEVLRSSARAFGAELRPQSNFQGFLEFYVDLLLEMHRSQPDRGLERAAFEFADSERGRLFYEALAQSEAEVRDDVPEELRQEEKNIQQRMNALYGERTALLAGGGDGPEVARIDRDLRRLTREYDKVRGQIVVQSHRFPELRNPRRPDLPAIQQLLDPDTLLLRFFLGEESSVLFLVGRSHFSSHRLPPRKTIEDLAQVVYDGWSSRQRRKVVAATMATEPLSSHLLGPVAAHPEARRLVIVADGMLHYVPFSALLLPLSLAGQPEDTLIDRYELVQLPLAAALEDLHRRESNPLPPRLVAILADPVFSAKDERLKASPPRRSLSDRVAATRLAASDGLRRLRWSGAEADSIRELVPPEKSHVARGFDANRELVLSGVLEEYRIIHVASHALIDEEHPPHSRLVLSGVTPGGEPRDGSVALHEIYTLNLPASLIVLSGCQTALGERVQGEGLVGWTRGFFFAGASKLMVSLWEIDDEATAAFMARFYEGIFLRGQSPAAALRDTQRFMKEHPYWNEPYFWAGFVLQGDWHAIAI